MTQIQTKLEWEPNARQKYEKMITKIPLFHREIAKIVVDKKRRCWPVNAAPTW